MKGIEFAPAARHDLAEIWFYTFDRWGSDQADVYTGAIHAALRLAADRSPTAQSIEIVRSGYCGSEQEITSAISLGKPMAAPS